MYIINFTLDLIECVAKIALTYDSDKPATNKIIIFRNVGNISVKRYHDASDICLGDYNGFKSEVLSNNQILFTIDTGDSIVSFEASDFNETTS